MKRGNFLRTIILALMTLVCCIMFSEKTIAGITINVNGGAAAVMNPASQTETEDTNSENQVSITVPKNIPEGSISSGVYVDTVSLADMDYDEAIDRKSVV